MRNHRMSLSAYFGTASGPTGVKLHAYCNFGRQPGVPRRTQALGIRKGQQLNFKNPKSNIVNHHSIFAPLGRDMRVPLEAPSG
jgi:hypothetical protein